MPRRPLLAQQFDAVAPYYDAVMSVVPYAQWVEYLHDILARYDRQPQRILDVATGTGAVALLLARQGYRVTGVDISSRMIVMARRKARREGLTVDFLIRDATRLELPSEYDLAVSFFDSLNYILTAKGLRDAFAGVFRALVPAGLFVFDLNSEYTLKHNLFTQHNFWDESAKVKHLWTAGYNPRTRMATIEMDFFLPNGTRFHEVHKERAHRHEEVIHFLREAGFEFLDDFDAYSFLPAGKRSERIFYVARKP